MKPSPSQLERLTTALRDLRDSALSVEHSLADDIELVEPRLRDSARNLAHYLAVRQKDIRLLQTELAALGLSSLGRMEAHTMATLQAVIQALGLIAGQHKALPAPAIDFETGTWLLEAHTARLLGPAPAERKVRIMVTMPTQAATDPSVTRSLLASGMNVMRINCAHDDPEAWLAMIHHLKAAAEDLGRPCRVLADLAGPKLRTGRVAGDAIAKIRPVRDARGRVTRRARLVLTSEPGAPDTDGALPMVQVAEETLALVQPGDEVRLVDTRGRKRKLRVTERTDAGLIVETDRTIYLEAGIAVVVWRGGRTIARAAIQDVAPTDHYVELMEGDVLRISRQPDDPVAQPGPAAPGIRATIGCTLPEAFAAAAVQHSIFFDDGKIGGLIERVEAGHVDIRITQTAPGGAKLRGEKGINLPDTPMEVRAVTPDDVVTLGILAPHIDLVGLSFVRTPADVEALQDRLVRLEALNLGIVLKIENRPGFENLPKLLLTAMRSASAGVMLARGDLAVEVGYERLSEVQEEILWICEAAHVPVIWATQVLEGLATKGTPSRSEVTDAAMSGRAECVMLNKGPHILRAVSVLSRILDRMEDHQDKKTAMMRQLEIARLAAVIG